MERNNAPRNPVMMAVGLIVSLAAAALIILTDIEVPVLSAIGVVGIALFANSRNGRRLAS